MPTVRTEEDLLGIDDDPGEQKKTQDLLYDAIVTMFDTFDSGGVYVDAERVYGIVADNSTDNADALDAIAAANVPVQFPKGTIRTSRTWYPTRGFRGFSKEDADLTSITAASSFTGTHLVDVRDLNEGGQRFSDIQLNANFKGHVFGVSDTDHSEGGSSGFHYWDHVRFANAANGDYAFYFPDTVSSSGMESVGAILNQCHFTCNGGGGMIYLGVASDDILFVGTRMSIDGACTVWPVRIHGRNIEFNRTYCQQTADTGSGIDAYFYLTSAGQARNFEGVFFEPGSITLTNMKYNWRFDGAPKTSINGVDLEGSGPTLPSDSALCVLSVGNSAGYFEVRNVSNGWSGIGMTKLLAIETHATQIAGRKQRVEFSGVDQFATLIHDANTEVDTEPRVYLHGQHLQESYDHLWETDGTNFTITDQRQIVAEVTFAAGTATVASAGTAVKLVAVTTQKGAASGFTVGTDNTLTTAKPGLRRYRVWGRFLVDIASGTDNVTLHVFVGAASAFETAAQAITAATAKLFEIDVVLEIDDAQAIEIYAENEDAVVNVTTAAYAERVDTTPAHGFLRVSQV